MPVGISFFDSVDRVVVLMEHVTFEVEYPSTSGGWSAELASKLNLLNIRSICFLVADVFERVLPFGAL